jgi:hypothetical protein
MPSKRNGKHVALAFRSLRGLLGCFSLYHQERAERHRNSVKSKSERQTA